jgi:hypothetical protein
MEQKAIMSENSKFLMKKFLSGSGNFTPPLKYGYFVS